MIPIQTLNEVLQVHSEVEDLASAVSDLHTDLSTVHSELEALQADITELSNQMTGSVVFSANGTWTCPSGITEVYVTAVGGGGGGGASMWANAGTVSVYTLQSSGSRGGQGGSAAKAVYKVPVAVTPGTVYNIQIGSGGNGGTAGGSTIGQANDARNFNAMGANAGSAGGVTSLSTGAVTLVSVAGGSGGVSGNTLDVAGNDANISIANKYGVESYSLVDSFATGSFGNSVGGITVESDYSASSGDANGFAGGGGSSLFGKGGNGNCVLVATGSAYTVTGDGGTGNGSGGGGGCQLWYPTGTFEIESYHWGIGGNGSPGFLKISFSK